MVKKLGFKDIKDAYWESLTFIFPHNDNLSNQRHSLININLQKINSEKRFKEILSGGALF